MVGWTVCPGCGLRLRSEGGERDYRVNASPDCLRVYAEVTGFGAQNPSLLRLNQLSLDAYGAQHGGGGVPPIRLTYSLVGLHLALDHGLTGEQVRAAHQRMGKPNATWPTLTVPSDLGQMTVMTVAEQGLMRHSVSGHEATTRHWAKSVWLAWASQRQLITHLTRRLLPSLDSL